MDFCRYKSIMTLLIIGVCTQLFTGCSNAINLAAIDAGEKLPVKTSIIYLIHGDGSYLYYDTNNRAVTADERILEHAQSVAANLYSSEVFIFHIKIQQRFLGLIQRNDRNLYYYRRGKLIKYISYRISFPDSSFQTEAAVYNRLSSASASKDAAGSIFLFYGHHIPEQTVTDYYASHHGIRFSTDIFRQTLAGFLSYKTSGFDLVVLSTCSNGTPGTISSIYDLSYFIIASPENLHLSHIDSRYLAVLEGSASTDLKHFAEGFAASAFDTLKKKTNTAITLSLYDTRAVKYFLIKSKDSYLRNLQAENPNSPRDDYSDCIYDGRMDMKGAETGVTVYFRPSLFGKSKNRTSHSGWGCPATKF